MKIEKQSVSPIRFLFSLAIFNGVMFSDMSFANTNCKNLVLVVEQNNAPAVDLDTTEAANAIPKRQEIFRLSNIKIVDGKVKVAFFDADDTLRTSTEGNPSSNTKEEVKILDGRAQKLRKLSEEGYLIAIVSNQGGIPKRYSLETAEEVFRHTVKLLIEEGGVVNYFDFAENYDQYRKPNPGMYQRLEEQIQLHLGAALTIDKDQSFMVGNGAYTKGEIRPNGERGTDFSNSDRLFAENLGLRFFEPAEFFEARKNEGATMKVRKKSSTKMTRQVLTKELAQPGTTLVVREITKNVLGEPGDTLEIHLNERASLDIGKVIAKTTRNLLAKPGDLLEILEGPALSKAQVNSILVKDLRTGLIGTVWWAELKWSTYLAPPLEGDQP